MAEKKVRIAVLVSGAGTNLQAIIDAEKNRVITSGTVALVISDNEQAYAINRAQSAGIKCIVVSKKKFDVREKLDKDLIRNLKKNNIDLIVLAGFMSILSEEFTATFANRIINVHPSLIPSFCGKGFYGLKVHEAALKKGVKVTGATVHYVNEIPDDGEIIMQKAVSVRQGDTPATLQKRVMKQAEWIILPKSVELICRRMITD